jgi:hypothetical protein
VKCPCVDIRSVVSMASERLASVSVMRAWGVARDVLEVCVCDERVIAG